VKSDFFVANTKNENFEKFIENLERSYQAKIGVLEKTVDGLMANYIGAKNEIFDSNLKAIKKNEKISEMEEELKNLNAWMRGKGLAFDRDSFLGDSGIRNEMESKLVVSVDNTQESVMICDKPDQSLVIADSGDDPQMIQEYRGSLALVDSLKDSKDHLEAFMRNYISLGQKFQTLDLECSKKTSEIGQLESRIKLLNQNIKKKINYELNSKKETAFKVEQENLRLKSHIATDKTEIDSLSAQIIFLKKSLEHTH
jgi:hypothetical protein